MYVQSITIVPPETLMYKLKYSCDQMPLPPTFSLKGNQHHAYSIEFCNMSS